MLFNRFWIAVGIIVALPSVSLADTVIYKSKNKLDFVKLDGAKKKEIEGGLKHPYTFEPEQMRAILRSLHFNKRILLLKDLEDQRLFDEGNVEFLMPYLIEAFRKAGSEEAVVVSYFTRDSKILIQNDRLTIFRAFVKEDGLHFVFTKLYAKILGDRNTRSPEMISHEARSIRVGLNAQPGQNRLSWDPEEIVFDLAYYTPMGIKVSSPPGEKKKGKDQAETPPQTTDTGQKPVRERLKELDDLRKDELITEKEYKKKRQELLQQL